MSTRNNMLIHHAIHNSIAGGNGAGCPRYIRQHLLEILEQHKKEDLFNPCRLDEEDVQKIIYLISELGNVADYVESLESQIENIAKKYWNKHMEICQK